MSSPEHAHAPVSRLTLFAFASASLLCAFDALLHHPSEPSAKVSAAQRLVSPAGEDAARGGTNALSVAGRLAMLCRTATCSWLAWPTVAETIAGSILILRLFACERHIGSPKVAFFLASALALSFSFALGFELGFREHALAVEFGIAQPNGTCGWGPSVVFMSLLVRHLAETPVRARLVVLNTLRISDKALEVLLALQVPPHSCEQKAASTRSCLSLET
jgi:hypothetical protein